MWSGMGDPITTVDNPLDASNMESPIFLHFIGTGVL